VSFFLLPVILFPDQTLKAADPADALQQALAGSRDFSAETLKSLEPSDREKITKGKVIAIFDDIPGYATALTRAIAILPHPPEVIWQVILDYDNYQDFMPFTRESRIDASRSGGEVLFFYTELALPVVSDRYYTLKFTIEEKVLGKPGTFFMKWDLDPERESNFILNSGSWHLVPYGPGGQNTLTFLTVANDPGGNIPNFIKKRSSAAAITANFKAISNRAGAGLAQKIYYMPIPEDKLDRTMKRKVDESRTLDGSFLERFSAGKLADLNEGEVLVTMNDIKGTWVEMAQAVALLRAPSSRVLEVITEYEQYKDYMPYVSVIEVDKARSKGNVQYISYRLHYRLLPYIKDRYFTIKMIEEKLPDVSPGTYFLSWRLDRTNPSNFSRNSGSWKLVPCGEGGSDTLVFWTILANPGGLSPWFWRNLSEKRVARDIIKAIRERAEK